LFARNTVEFGGWRYPVINDEDGFPTSVGSKGHVGQWLRGAREEDEKDSVERATGSMTEAERQLREKLSKLLVTRG
jgi:hypothetical protein